MTTTKTSSPHLFKHVSLLSTSDVRYDGRLYIIDHDAKTIALHHVRCLGTEGRKSGDQEIAPSSSTYEFIIFRAANIKQLYLKLSNGEFQELTQEILEPLRRGRSTQQQVSQDHMDNTPKRVISQQVKQSRNNMPYNQPLHQQQMSPQRHSRSHQQQLQPTPNYRQGRRTKLQPQPQQMPMSTGPKRKVGNVFQTYGSYDNYYDEQPYEQYVDDRQQYQQPQQPYYDMPYNTQRSYTPRRRTDPPMNSYGRSRNYYQVNKPIRRSQYNNRSFNQRPYTGRNQYNVPRTYNQNRSRDFNRGPRPKPGTGAFLTNKRIYGEDTNVNTNKDFDFEKYQDKLHNIQDTKTNENDENKITTINDDNNENKENKEKEENLKKDDENDDSGLVYKKSKGFFDGLVIESERDRNDDNKKFESTNKNVDVDTFGSVANSYRPTSNSRPYRKNYRNRYNNTTNNYNYNRNRTRNTNTTTNSNRRYQPKQQMRYRPVQTN